MLKRGVYIALLLLVSCQLWSQSVYFRNFTTADGLSNSKVNGIAQDTFGFLWVATQHGLNRFDGYSFTHFYNDPADSTTIASNVINSVFCDSKGRLWVGTSGGGLNQFDFRSNTFIRYPFYPEVEDGFPSNSVNHFMEDNDGSLWISSINLSIAQGNMAHFNPETGSFISFSILNDPNYKTTHRNNGYIRKMYQDVTNPDYLLLTGSNGLLQFHKQSGIVNQWHWTNLDSMNIHGSCTAIWQQGDSIIWITSWGAGLLRFDRRTETWTRLPHLPARMGLNAVMDVLPTADGLWLAYLDQGPVWFNPATNQFRSFTTSQSAAGTPLLGTSHIIFYDREGRIWFGGERGISAVDPRLQLFNHVPLPGRFEFEDRLAYTSDLMEDPATHHYLVAQYMGQGLLWVDPSTGEITRKIDSVYSVAGNRVPFRPIKFQQIGTDTIAVLSREGVFWYLINGASLVRAQQFNKLPFIYMDAAITDDQRVWLGTHFDGLIMWQPATDSVKRYTTEQGLISIEYAHVLLPDGDYLWVGTKRGLTRLHLPTDSFHSVATDTVGKWLSAFAISKMVKDEQGRIWIGTYQDGLYYYDPAEHRFYSAKKQRNIHVSMVDDMQFDNMGYLWLANEKGLLRFDPSTGILQEFTTSHGLHNQLGRIPRLVMLPNDLMAVCFRDGFDVFRPANFPQQEDHIPLYLGGFALRQQQVRCESGDTLSLNWSDNFFEFQFRGIDLTQSEQITYQYRLLGLEDTWTTAGKDRNANYTSVPNGRYVFQVRVAGSNGQWQPQSNLLYLVIAPPFWTTPWFITLVAALVIMVLFAGYHIRIRQIKAREALRRQYEKKLSEVEMKALKAQMNPHFLFNTLNSIKHYIIQNNPRKASDYLAKFSKLIRLILHHSQEQTITLRAEMDAISLYIEMERMRFHDAFTCTWTLQDGLYAEEVMLPPMLLQPYVENAVWHGLMHRNKGGHLSMNTIKVGDKLIHTITDNGIGRKAAAKIKAASSPTHTSMGTRITADRLSLLRDVYQITAEVHTEDLYDNEHLPAGTKVTVITPYITKTNHHESTTGR